MHVLSRAWFVLDFPSNEQQTEKNTNKATGYNDTFFQQGVWNVCFCVIIFDVGFPKRGTLPTPIHHIRHDTSSGGTTCSFSQVHQRRHAASHRPHLEVEAALAEFLCMEAAITCPAPLPWSELYDKGSRTFILYRLVTIKPYTKKI